MSTCLHAHVRTFRSLPPHSKCLDCGVRVELRWVAVPIEKDASDCACGTSSIGTLGHVAWPSACRDTSPTPHTPTSPATKET